MMMKNEWICIGVGVGFASLLYIYGYIFIKPICEECYNTLPAVVLTSTVVVLGYEWYMKKRKVN